MGKNTKRVKEFIESIPDAKLSNLSKGAGTIFKDSDFRLDMQGMTSGNPQKHNLQVQINRETTITSLKKSAPATVSTFIAPAGTSAQDVRQKLIDGIKI